jgi:hypothetical protein
VDQILRLSRFLCQQPESGPGRPLIIALRYLGIVNGKPAFQEDPSTDSADSNGFVGPSYGLPEAACSANAQFCILHLPAGV